MKTVHFSKFKFNFLKIIALIFILNNHQIVKFSCDIQCNTCDISGCLTCNGNRINPPTCNCPSGYLDIKQPNCIQERNKCTIPPTHILHINDGDNYGSVPTDGYKTNNSAYYFDGAGSHRTLPSM